MTLRDSVSSERLKTIVSLSGPMTQVNLPVRSISQVKVISSPLQAALLPRLEIVGSQADVADTKTSYKMTASRRMIVAQNIFAGKVQSQRARSITRFLEGVASSLQCSVQERA